MTRFLDAVAFQVQRTGCGDETQIPFGSDKKADTAEAKTNGLAVLMGLAID
jgi:hypothetical protein